MMRNHIFILIILVISSSCASKGNWDTSERNRGIASTKRSLSDFNMKTQERKQDREELIFAMPIYFNQF